MLTQDKTIEAKNKFNKDESVIIDYSDYPELAQRGDDGIVGTIKEFEFRNKTSYYVPLLNSKAFYYLIETDNGDFEWVCENYLIKNILIRYEI